MAAKSLTPLAVKNAKPDPARRREIPDGKGLYLVIQPAGAKSWALRYRHGGKPAKLTLGPLFAPRDDEPEPANEPEIGRPLTLAQARRLAGNMLHTLAQGIDPAVEQRRAKKAKADQVGPDPDLFEEVARRFLDRYARPNTKASTFAETANVLGFRTGDDGKLALRPGEAGKPLPGAAAHWKGRRVQDITKRDVNELLDAVADSRGGYAANSTFSAIRRLFNWCVEQDIRETSPCLGVKKRAQAVERERVLTDAELRLVWLAAGEVGWPFGHLVRLLTLTGARRDEWAEARWSEIDLGRRVFSLPAVRSKNGLAHLVPLTPQACTVLEQLKGHRLKGEPDWLFSTGYGRRRPDGTAELAHISGFSKAKARLDAEILEIARREAAEREEDPEKVKPLPDWRFHDLRRTAVSGMARLGVALPVIERAVNHISGSFAGVVRVYQRHDYANEVRDALERWAAGVERVAAGEALELSNIVPLRA